MEAINNELKVCVMCGFEKDEGIIIHSGFICEECEFEIVHTDVTDEKYLYFIKRMKTLWLKNA